MNIQYISQMKFLSFERLVDQGMVLPLGAGAVSRFLSDLNADHPVCYAMLGFFGVILAALTFSLISERMIKLLGYQDKGACGAHGKRD